MNMQPYLEQYLDSKNILVFINLLMTAIIIIKNVKF